MTNTKKRMEDIEQFRLRWLFAIGFGLAMALFGMGTLIWFAASGYVWQPFVLMLALTAVGATLGVAYDRWKDSGERLERSRKGTRALWLVLLAGSILVGCHRCPECPQPDPCPAQTVVVHPEPPSSLVEVTTVEEPPIPTWLPVDPADLVGDWLSEDGKPLPTLGVVADRSDSKTPFNLQLRNRTAPVAVGCGFYAGGDAFCREYQALNDPTEEVVRRVVSWHMNGPVLRFDIDGVFSGTFIRKGNDDG